MNSWKILRVINCQAFFYHQIIIEIVWPLSRKERKRVLFYSVDLVVVATEAE